MNTNDRSDRRSFLKTAGAVMVAASVPVAVSARPDDARPQSGNNLKQMIIFGGVSEPLSTFPGNPSFQFQMRVHLDTFIGIGVLTDACFTGNSCQVKVFSGRLDANNMYIFQGTVHRTENPDLMGKPVVIQVQRIDANENCNVSLTIENTPIAALLLPAVQKIRVPIYG